MRKTKLEIAKPLITSYFNGLPINIFKVKELFAHLAKNKEDWELAKSTTPRAFIQFLIEKSRLKQLDFPFPYRHETRFVWGEVPLLRGLINITQR